MTLTTKSWSTMLKVKASFEDTPPEKKKLARQIVMELTQIAPSKFEPYKPNGFIATNSMSHVEVWVSSRSSRDIVVSIVEEYGLIEPMRIRVQEALSRGGWDYRTSDIQETANKQELCTIFVTGRK